MARAKVGSYGLTKGSVIRLTSAKASRGGISSLRAFGPAGDAAAPIFMPATPAKGAKRGLALTAISGRPASYGKQRISMKMAGITPAITSCRPRRRCLTRPIAICRVSHGQVGGPPLEAIMPMAQIAIYNPSTLSRRSAQAGPIGRVGRGGLATARRHLAGLRRCRLVC